MRPLASAPGTGASRFALAALIAGVTAGLVSCAAEPTIEMPVPTWTELAGQPFSAVLAFNEEVDPDAMVAVLDSSVLLDADPTYDSSQFGNAKWTILAACGDGKDWTHSKSIQVSVVPTELVNEEVQARIESGEFADSVECES